MTSATITKSPMDSYSIRSGGEWARICIDSYTAYGDERKRHGGEILVYSSFGSYNNHWTHCGVPFPQFLTGLEFDYFMGKTRGSASEEFDPDGSAKCVKERLIELRRRGDLDKEGARTLWSGVEHLDVASNAHEFMDIMNGLDSDVKNSRYYLIDDAYEYITTRPVPETVSFWREIWPLFIAELKREVKS